MEKIDQVLANGSSKEDFDQPLKTPEIFLQLKKLFGSSVKQDYKQFIVYDQVALLVANITYLGHPWQPYKKRIQLKSYYPDYLVRNSKNRLRSFYVGIYHYEEVILFAVFDPATYESKKSHNSSAHVQTYDLQYAIKKGFYSKVDKNGNRISILTPKYFKNFIESKVGKAELDEKLAYEDLIQDYLKAFVGTLPKTWLGIPCYKEMTAAKDNNAKQGEWVGFYFEYRMKKYLADHPTDVVRWNSDKRSTGIDLDVQFPKRDWFYGDLKADAYGKAIPGNSFDTMDEVIKNHHGRVWYINLGCKEEKDSDHEYQVSKFWDLLRGGKYKKAAYVGLKERYGRRMKYSATPVVFQILNIDETALEILRKHPFKQGLNSDHKARKEKLQITKDIMDALCIYKKELK